MSREHDRCCSGGVPAPGDHIRDLPHPGHVLLLHLPRPLRLRQQELPGAGAEQEGAGGGEEPGPAPQPRPGGRHAPRQEAGDRARDHAHPHHQLRPRRDMSSTRVTLYIKPSNADVMLLLSWLIKTTIDHCHESHDVFVNTPLIKEFINLS